MSLCKLNIVMDNGPFVEDSPMKNDAFQQQTVDQRVITGIFVMPFHGDYFIHNPLTMCHGQVTFCIGYGHPTIGIPRMCINRSWIDDCPRCEIDQVLALVSTWFQQTNGLIWRMGHNQTVVL